MYISRYISCKIMENIIFAKIHLVAEYFHFMQKTDVFVEIYFTRSICQRRLASKKRWICNKTTYDETFLIMYYMWFLGIWKWTKVYLLSEMKICCWHKRKLETLWKVCVSFIIVLKRSQTLRETGLSCVQPLCKLNWLTPSLCRI